MDKDKRGPEEEDNIVSLEEILAEYYGEAITQPLRKERQENQQLPENIIDFPIDESEYKEGKPEEHDDEEEKPRKPSIFDKVDRKLSKIREQADDYAEHMYEYAGQENAEETLLAEELLPAVDIEDEQIPEEDEPKPRQKWRKRKEPEPPDTNPEKLARLYGKGLSFLRIRVVLVFIIAILQLVLTVTTNLRLLGETAEMQQMACYLSSGLLLFAMVLGIDRLAVGLFGLIRLYPTMESMLLLACVASVFDGLTMPLLGMRGGQLPYGLACTATLGFYMAGTRRKREGQRLACHLAAGVKEPYRVSLDEDVWNRQDSFCKYRGSTEGFGSQIQKRDGAERLYLPLLRVLIPLLFILTLILSIGRGKPEQAVWMLSVLFTLCTPFYGLLVYASPYLHITRRLGKSGAALAGWEGAENTRSGDGILLSDSDLFPPGMVELVGTKTFGKVTAETSLMYTHAMLNEVDSGLTKCFYDLMRRRGCSPKRANKVAVHDGDGLSGYVKDSQVLVGSSSFMRIMGISIPEGLKTETAVYCAINGKLSAVFAIHYSMHENIYSGVLGLVRGGLTPILATRDFNISPTMLDKRWSLPVDKMQFPAYARRLELSAQERTHDGTLTALLAREGLAPYYEAVMGARKLRLAVRLGVLVSMLGIFMGLFMAFYLTWSSAFFSLSSLNIFLFLLLWLVPNFFLRYIFFNND